MKATVALFDIDGTLVLTSGAGMRALERAAVEVCGVAGATRGIQADGKTDHLLAAEIAAALPAGTTPEGFAERLFAAYVVHLVDEVARSQYRILPGVEVAIAAAEACVPAVGLATGNIAHAARRPRRPRHRRARGRRRHRPLRRRRAARDWRHWVVETLEELPGLLAR